MFSDLPTFQLLLAYVSIILKHDMNQQIVTNKPQIWQLVSSITNWYIWKAMFEGISKCDWKTYPNNFGIWTEIVHNLGGSLHTIKGNMQQAELKWLQFHAICNGGKRISGKVEWFYSTKQDKHEWSNFLLLRLRNKHEPTTRIKDGS